MQFVSVKVAALDVVCEKLKRTRLDEFCLKFHSHKANKKADLDDLYNTLSLPKTALNESAEIELGLRKKARERLDAYEYELHCRRNDIACSLYELYEKYLDHSETDDLDFDIEDISLKGYSYLQDADNLLEQFVKMRSVICGFYCDSWYGFIGAAYKKSEIRKMLKSASFFIDGCLNFYK